MRTYSAKSTRRSFGFCTWLGFTVPLQIWQRPKGGGSCMFYLSICLFYGFRCELPTLLYRFYGFH